MLLLRICVTCQQKPAAEKQLRRFFIFSSRFVPLRQAASIRLRALPRDICQGQWQRERLESIPGRVSTTKERRGLRRSLFNQLHLGRVFLAEGQKAEFSADAEIIHCAASGGNWRADGVVLKAFPLPPPPAANTFHNVGAGEEGGSCSGASGPLSPTHTVMEPSPAAPRFTPVGHLCLPLQIFILCLCSVCAVKWSHPLWLTALLPAANNGIGLISCHGSYQLSTVKPFKVRTLPPPVTQPHWNIYLLQLTYALTGKADWLLEENLFQARCGNYC